MAACTCGYRGDTKWGLFFFHIREWTWNKYQQLVLLQYMGLDEIKLNVILPRKITTPTAVKNSHQSNEMPQETNWFFSHWNKHEKLSNNDSLQILSFWVVYTNMMWANISGWHTTCLANNVAGQVWVPATPQFSHFYIYYSFGLNISSKSCGFCLDAESISEPRNCLSKIVPPLDTTCLQNNDTCSGVWETTVWFRNRLRVQNPLPGFKGISLCHFSLFNF